MGDQKEGARSKRIAPTFRALRLLANALKWLGVRLPVHEATRVRIAFHPIPAARIKCLRSVANCTAPSVVSNRLIDSHRTPLTCVRRNILTMPLGRGRLALQLNWPLWLVTALGSGRFLCGIVWKGWPKPPSLFSVKELSPPLSVRVLDILSTPFGS